MSFTCSLAEWGVSKIPLLIDWLICLLIYFSTPASKPANEALVGVSVYFIAMLRSAYLTSLFMQCSKLHVKTPN